jgi:hypothetical protein
MQAAHPPVTEVAAPAPSSTTPVSIGFSGDGLATFRCAMDGGALAPCTSPLTPDGQTHGEHVLTILGEGPGGTAKPVTERWWISDRIPATPAFTSTPPSPSGLSVSFSFTDVEDPVTFRCSLDDADGSPCTSPATVTGLSIGSHTFSVSALDAGDNLSLPVTFGWTVQTDVTPPLITMKKPAADTLLTTRKVLAQWSSTDSGSGLDHIELTQKDGLSGTPVLVQSNLASSFTIVSAASGTYCFRATSFDRQGNQASGATRCAAVPLDDRDLSYTGPTAPAAPSAAFDATVTRLTGAGSATFTFTGRRYGVRFRKGPDLGKASVTLDGGAPKIIDLYAGSSKPSWWTQQFDTSGPHTVRIAWTGQKNSSATGTDVSVDAVATISDDPPNPV